MTAELTVSGKVELTWDTYRCGVCNVVDGIRGSTRGPLGRIVVVSIKT